MRNQACLFTILSVACALAQAGQPQPVFTYEEAGIRLGTAHYKIELFANGLFRATATSAPFRNGSHTEHRFQRILNSIQIAEILGLAIHATDFNSGCNHLEPDGMWARMMVVTSAKPISRGSGLINNWSDHPEAEALVFVIMSYLPPEMQNLPM